MIRAWHRSLTRLFCASGSAVTMPNVPQSQFHVSSAPLHRKSTQHSTPYQQQ